MEDKMFKIEDCPEEVTCCKFHKVSLNLFDDLRGDFWEGEWYDIPTTGVNQILDTQIRDIEEKDAPELTKVKGAEKIKRVFWALLGRLLYHLDEGPCVTEDYEEKPRHYKQKDLLGGDNWQPQPLSAASNDAQPQPAFVGCLVTVLNNANAHHDNAT